MKAKQKYLARTLHFLGHQQNYEMLELHRFQLSVSDVRVLTSAYVFEVGQDLGEASQVFTPTVKFKGYQKFQ
jgi:hypothetical protein